MTEDFEENVDEVLQAIENKYSSNVNFSPKNELEKQLYTISQEFETFGLPSVNLNECGSTLLQQIVSNSLFLVQCHRKTLSQINDMKLCGNLQDSKNTNLEKTISHLEQKIETLDNNNIKLKRKTAKLSDQCSDLKKTIEMHSGETTKLKMFLKSKQNELNHHINSLRTENHHLKEICGKDIDKYYSKDEKFLKILKQYKRNEAVYKSSIQKLEDNNAAILEEILNLKGELALAYADKK